MTFFYDLNKKLATIADKPQTQQLNEGAVAETSYSAKAARAGKDIGKPGKAFGQIAKSAGERYGSKERGEKVAGAVLAKLRGKNESVRSPITKEEYGPLEEKQGGMPMTPKQKSFAKLAPPKDKITFADKIAGAKQEVDEMLGDVAAEAMKSALKGGQKKLDRNHNGKLDAQDFAMLRAGKGKEETDESALQAYLGKKKYGADGMKALQKAGREGASEKTMDKIRSQHEVDEGWDDMIKDVDRRRLDMKKGEKKQGHKGEIERTATGIKHTRRYDPKSGETETGDDDTPKGEKRRGRPKGTGKAMGAKGPSGKSKLLTKEDDNMTDDIRQAMATLKKAGYKVTKAAEQELDEKAVSQQQQKFMGMAHAMQKGEKVKGASPELKKVARTMKPKDVEDFAATKHKGLPKKVKAKEEVEETTVSGSVATAPEAPKAKSKGGVQFGKGIYDSMNRELEQMIAESMNISMNMSNNPEGGPAKSLTVTATDEDAMYLGKLLKMAGVDGDQEGGCGCGQTPCACNSADQVDENAPDWPTDEVESDNALQYAGGLNKPKTTVAGDGQTTVPVTAVQVREEAEEELDEQEQVIAPESRDTELDEELQRMREMAGIGEAAKPDFLDVDKDGNEKESMKKAADDAEKDKKVEESILDMTRLWKAYKG